MCAKLRFGSLLSAMMFLVTLGLTGCGDSATEIANIRPAPPLAFSGQLPGEAPFIEVVIEIPLGASSLNAAAFGTNPLVIEPGTTVTWFNTDTDDHTITSDTGLFSSDLIPFDEETSFSFLFTEPGTYAYHCSVHPEMTGSIIVAAPVTP